jgi:DNA-directed RNA polymerase beta subunit
MQKSIEEEYPAGVALRDWHDSDTLRSTLFDGVKEELRNSFPKSQGGVTLHLEDLDYADKDHFSLKEQKDAKLSDKYLYRRLRGKLKLVDDESGEVLDEGVQTLMKVPYLTERGTFIHNGNEYALVNQSRLRSGIYTRKKASGDIEAHVNAERGKGNSYHVRFEPQTQLFKLDVGQSQLHLYSLLKHLGYPDKDLKAAWGEELFDANAKKYDARVFQKAYERIAGRKAVKGATDEEKAEAIREALESTQVETEILERTLLM